MDIKVVEYKDALPITDILATRAKVPTIAIVGSNFKYATQVVMDGILSPKIYIVSDTKILAELPPSLYVSPVSSVEVLGNGTVKTKSTRLVFTLNSQQKISGIQKLVQLFVKLLLQAPNSDLFDDVGGGLLNAIGVSYSDKDIDNIRRLLVLGITNVSKWIIGNQATLSIPLSEKLLMAELEEFSVGQEGGKIYVVIKVVNQLNDEIRTGSLFDIGVG